MTRRKLTEIPVVIVSSDGEPQEWILEVDPAHVEQINSLFPDERLLSSRISKTLTIVGNMKKILLREDVTIETAPTEIGHSLGVIPTVYTVKLKGAATWFEASRPTTQSIFLQASATVTADIFFQV